MKQAWAKQAVGGNGRRDSGRGRACRSGVERMRGAAAWSAPGFSSLWNRLEGKGRGTHSPGSGGDKVVVGGARDAQSQGFKTRETLTVNTLERRYS